MADYNSKYTGSEIDSAIGKVLNNEVGGMILIPSAVLNLTPASSSSDILSAFGGKEVFKSICQNVLNGIHLIKILVQVLLILFRGQEIIVLTF